MKQAERSGAALLSAAVAVTFLIMAVGAVWGGWVVGVARAETSAGDTKIKVIKIPRLNAAGEKPREGVEAPSAKTTAPVVEDGANGPSSAKSPFGPLIKVPPPAPAEASDRVLAERLVEELESSVSVIVRARAQQYLTGREDGTTIAKAWSDYAVAMHLLGARNTAAWAGLRAMLAEWRNDYITNSGVYLIQLGRASEGVNFLKLAQRRGHRSPYLQEALASGYDRLGNATAAKQHIDRAAQMAPDDTAIAVEASVLNTGAPPPKSGERKQTELERAFGEYEEHVNFVIESMQALARDLDAMENAAGFGANVFRADYLDGTTQGLRYGIETARVHLGQANSSPAIYNLTLLGLVASYTGASLRLLESHDELGAEWAFWADVLGMDERFYVRTLFKHLKRMKEFQHSDPDLYPDFGDLYISSAWDGLLFMLLTSDWIDYQEEKCRLDTGKPDCSGPSRTPTPCVALAELLKAYEAGTARKFEVMGADYQFAARRLLVWKKLVVLDAQDYARRWLKRLRRHDGDDTMLTLEQRSLRNLRLTYRQLMPFQPEFFLEKQAGRFALERDGLAGDFSYEWESLRECQASTQRRLSDLSIEELEKLLREIEELMKQDITAEAKFNPECNASFGPFSVSFDASGKGKAKALFMSVDESGKFIRELGGIGVDTDRSGVTGVTVEIGHKISGGEGLVGSVEIKVAGEWNPRTGEWDAVAEIGGKLGIGIAVPAVGEIACYPGSGKVTLQARSFLRHEVAQRRIIEAMQRR
ncbi:MAG: hypothetical protein IIB68_06760 [Proteobacteria bacterium]|nr:hypothetical protein [Pseudomonadota bacterium]